MLTLHGVSKQGSEKDLKQHKEHSSMLDDSKLDTITLTPNELELSQSLNLELNSTKEVKCDDKQSSVPVCENNEDTHTETQPEHCGPEGKRIEVSSEIESMPNIPSACSSNKEMTCEGDTTLSANSPAEGKLTNNYLYL